MALRVLFNLEKKVGIHCGASAIKFPPFSPSAKKKKII